MADPWCHQEGTCLSLFNTTAKAHKPAGAGRWLKQPPEGSREQPLNPQLRDPHIRNQAQCVPHPGPSPENA